MSDSHGTWGPRVTGLASEQLIPGQRPPVYSQPGLEVRRSHSALQMAHASHDTSWTCLTRALAEDHNTERGVCDSL